MLFSTLGFLSLLSHLQTHDCCCKFGHFFFFFVTTQPKRKSILQFEEPHNPTSKAAHVPLEATALNPMRPCMNGQNLLRPSLFIFSWHSRPMCGYLFDICLDLKLFQKKNHTLGSPFKYVFFFFFFVEFLRSLCFDFVDLD